MFPDPWYIPPFLRTRDPAWNESSLLHAVCPNQSELLGLPHIWFTILYALVVAGAF